MPREVTSSSVARAIYLTQEKVLSESTTGSGGILCLHFVYCRSVNL